MKLKIWGLVLLVAGALGIIISAWIGSDWPMYAFVIISCVGVSLLLFYRSAKSSPREPSRG